MEIFDTSWGETHFHCQISKFHCKDAVLLTRFLDALLTDPQIALVLNIVTLHGHLLGLQNGLLDIGGSLLEHEVQLLEGFIDGHSAHKGGDVPHLVRTVFDVVAHMADVLKMRVICCITTGLSGGWYRNLAYRLPGLLVHFLRRMDRLVVLQPFAGSVVVLIPLGTQHSARVQGFHLEGRWSC